MPLLFYVKLFVVFSFSQGFLFQIGVPNNYYKYAMVLSSFSLLLYTLLNKIYVKKGTKYFVFLYSIYAFSLFISYYLSQSTFKDAFSWYMYSFPGFTLFLFVTTQKINPDQIKRMNSLFFYIAGFQIFYSIMKLIFKGTSETVAGTLHFSNGSLNTIFPLMAIGMVISFYLYYGRKKQYLLLALGFLLMSWAGEKRAVYFYLVFLVIVSYLMLVRFNRLGYGRLIYGLGIVSVLALMMVYASSKLNYTLNPEGEYGGSFNLLYIIDYAYKYYYQFNQLGYAAGRFSGFFAIIDHMYNADTITQFFGHGPSEIIGKTDLDFTQYKFGVSSFLGINGFSSSLVSLGLSGAVFTIFLYFSIIIYAYKFTKSEFDPYWKSIGFGTCLIMIIFFLDFFTYGRSSLHTICINNIIFYFLSVLVVRDSLKRFSSPPN